MASLVVVQSSKVWVCGNFSIVSVAVYPHAVQVLSLEPSAFTVASLVIVQSPKVWVCPSFSITSVASYPHTLQTLFLLPFFLFYLFFQILS